MLVLSYSQIKSKAKKSSQGIQNPDRDFSLSPFFFFFFPTRAKKENKTNIVNLRFIMHSQLRAFCGGVPTNKKQFSSSSFLKTSTWAPKKPAPAMPPIERKSKHTASSSPTNLPPRSSASRSPSSCSLVQDWRRWRPDRTGRGRGRICLRWRGGERDWWIEILIGRRERGGRWLGRIDEHGRR